MVRFYLFKSKIITIIFDFIYLLALDGWTDPQGNSLWAFMLMTGSRKEYLLSLEDLSDVRHTGEHLSNTIEEVIGKVGAEKFIAIVSDNGSNVAAARRIITNNHPNIINVRCIAHCFNLISTSIIKIDEVKYIVKCANILTKFFKNSTLRSLWLGMLNGPVQTIRPWFSPRTGPRTDFYRTIIGLDRIGPSVL